MQLLLIGLPGIAVAQADPEPGRLYRLLILDSQSGSPYEEIRQAFLDALAEYGYRTGVNLQLTLHSSGNDTLQGALLLAGENIRR